MTKTIKLLTLAFFLSFAFVACNNGDKECKEDCKKECCADKDKAACEPGCEKECCADKSKEACEPGCQKECCAGKTGDSSAMAPAGADEVHVCTDACKADPESCPHHTH